jgi:FAD/FMN-containing dehydrogenase
MLIPKEQIVAELGNNLSSDVVLHRDEPLARKTTLRVGGPADVYVEPASETDLAKILQVCAEYDVPHFILGRGSNLLIRDGGIRGVVISFAHANFSRIEILHERLNCGAGAKLKNVSVEARRWARVFGRNSRQRWWRVANERWRDGRCDVRRCRSCAFHG